MFVGCRVPRMARKASAEPLARKLRRVIGGATLCFRQLRSAGRASARHDSWRTQDRMPAVNPTHLIKARPAGTRVPSGEQRLTHVVRRVERVRAHVARRGYRRGSLSPVKAQAAVAWGFTANASSLAAEGLLRGIQHPQSGSKCSVRPDTPTSARRAEMTDRKARPGAGRRWGRTP